MADNNNNPSQEDGEWPRPPYAWILTPILLFAVIAAAATAIGLRRRRHNQRLAALPSHRAQRPSQNGRRAQTDLEAGRDAGRGRRWGGLRRREEGVEGLNEEGEAPPPYEAAGKKADAGVELEEVERVRERLPGYAEVRAGEGAAEAVRAPPAAVTRE